MVYVCVCVCVCVCVHGFVCLYVCVLQYSFRRVCAIFCVRKIVRKVVFCHKFLVKLFVLSMESLDTKTQKDLLYFLAMQKKSQKILTFICILIIK